MNLRISSPSPGRIRKHFSSNTHNTASIQQQSNDKHNNTTQLTENTKKHKKLTQESSRVHRADRWWCSDRPLRPPRRLRPWTWSHTDFLSFSPCPSSSFLEFFTFSYITRSKGSYNAQKGRFFPFSISRLCCRLVSIGRLHDSPTLSE